MFETGNFMFITSEMFIRLSDSKKPSWPKNRFEPFQEIGEVLLLCRSSVEIQVT